MAMIIVKFKKLRIPEDLKKLGLPAELWNIRMLDRGEIIEFYFDTDNENDVKDSLKIIKTLLKEYKEVDTKTKLKKKDVLKSLGA